MTTTTYRIAPAPKFAQFSSWDCSRCGRSEVKPVFLSGPDGIAPYGTGCAAKLLGYAKVDRVRTEFNAIQAAEDAREEMLAERKARYTKALAQFRSGIEDEVSAPELASCRKTYWQSGGSEVLGKFPEWMARVAETGSLD